MLQSTVMQFQSVVEIVVNLRRLRSWSTEADGVHKLRVRLLSTNYQEETLQARLLRETCDNENTWFVKPCRALQIQRDRSGTVVDIREDDLNKNTNTETMMELSSPKHLKKDHEYLTKRMSMYYSEGGLNEEDIDTILVYQVNLPFPSWKGYFCLLIDLCVQIMPVAFVD